MQSAQFKLFAPSKPAEIDELRLLFTEYAAGMGIDLCFQNFSQELIDLPGDYSEPRGTLVAARSNLTVVGCCALRALDSVDYPNACEMKRLYVQPAFRRSGLGRILAESILDFARQAGYAHVLLDTLNDMESARALYEDLGFVEIPPYYHNPIEGAHYLMVQL
jgi:ribosomal protein S18 acetylase RimI-like enzyme